jgi:RNA polymerase sigma-70 factor, ECF subfamily
MSLLLIHPTMKSPPSRPSAFRCPEFLRDVHGYAAAEVCTLEISDANQRVLLHRGRSRVRRALERYFTAT